MMKIFTSYFYQVRFFKPYQIPFSTAAFDPKWFHNYKSQMHKFIDKNGVLNGCRAEMLHPNESCKGLCSGKPCQFLPCLCDFLGKYEKQIFSIDKAAYLSSLNAAAKKIQCILKFSNEPEVILLVHESPANECSERRILQKFFNCEEWMKV